MISEILHNRFWSLKYSLKNRKCYFSGQPLKFSLCYLGRKKIHSLLSPRYENNDIWISKEQYFNMIKSGMV